MKSATINFLSMVLFVSIISPAHGAELASSNRNLSFVSLRLHDQQRASGAGHEILLREDAKTLGLAQPVSPSKVFDFTMQREVNRELGIK